LVTCSVRRHCCKINGQSRSSQPQFSRQWTGRNRNMHSIRAGIRYALCLQTASARGAATSWRTLKCVTLTEYIPILQPSGDLIIFRISDRALANNNVSGVRSETALADSYVLIRHIASFLFCFRLLFYYCSIPGCIRTFRHLDLKWRFGINASFFHPSWGFSRHMQKNQRLLNYGRTAGLVILSYYTQQMSLKRTEFATYWLAEWTIDD
jgi:hypothetical protein